MEDRVERGQEYYLALHVEGDLKNGKDAFPPTSDGSGR